MTPTALVFLEPRDGALSGSQLGLVTNAVGVADSVEVLLLGPATPERVAALAAHGAAGIHAVTDPTVLAPVAGPSVEVMASLCAARGFSVILLENSSRAADVAGALAVRLTAGVNWDLVDLRSEPDGLVGERLALHDSVRVEVGWTSATAIGVFRAGHLEPTSAAAPSVPWVLPVNVAPPARAPTVRVVRKATMDGGASGLDTADVIVSGGRGIGGPENVALLEQLAGALHGVVGVSMPVVEKGWYPYSHQVGQTGRTVRPKLYVACGISGAIQHRVGMSRSGTIVVVNIDPEAPIFGICDFGVVGDLTEVLPRLIELLQGQR